MSANRLQRNPSALTGGGAEGINPRSTPHPAHTPFKGFIEAGLITYLSSVFQVTLDPAHDLRAYDRMLGQKMVIDHLKTVAETQTSKG